MQRDPPVIRNAFLGNTGNYSFAARSLPAIATEPSSVALFSSPPFPFPPRYALPPWRCFTGSLPPPIARSPAFLPPAHTFLGIFCFRWTSFQCFAFASTFDHGARDIYWFSFNFFFFFFLFFFFVRSREKNNDFWGVISIRNEARSLRDFVKGRNDVCWLILIRAKVGTVFDSCSDRLIIRLIIRFLNVDMKRSVQSINWLIGSSWY